MGGVLVRALLFGALVSGCDELAITPIRIGCESRDQKLCADETALADAGILCIESSQCPGRTVCEPETGHCVPERPWAEMVRTFNLPDCPAGRALLVNTATDELNGGYGLSDVSQAGPTLSLAEALWIAANGSGPHTIAFDEGVFPASNPATIAITGSHVLPETVRQTCIDARERGVVVDWAPEAPPGSSLSALDEGSMLLGLTLLRLPRTLLVQGGSRVTGCRIRTDGVRSFEPTDGRGETVRSLSATVGPGNVIAGFYGVEVYGTGSEIDGNHFGWDPASRRLLELTNAVSIREGHSHLIAANVIAPERDGVDVIAIGTLGTTATIGRNFFGVDPSGKLIRLRAADVSISGSGAVVVGPGNVMGPNSGWGVVSFSAPAEVQVTRNRFSTQNLASAITYSIGGQASPGPPSIAAAKARQVTGSCPNPGTVELFDTGGERTEFLGEVRCEPGIDWSIPVPSPLSGTSVAATLTDTSGSTSPFSAPVAVP